MWQRDELDVKIDDKYYCQNYIPGYLQRFKTKLKKKKSKLVTFPK